MNVYFNKFNKTPHLTLYVLPSLLLLLPSLAMAENRILPELSGHIDLVSKYISRGLTNNPEDNNIAIQAGLNLSYQNFYVGYWGSTLDYSFPEFQGERRKRSEQFEHDFIVGYSHNFGQWTGDIWTATYYYPGGENTTSNEVGLTYARVLNEKTQVTASISSYVYDVVYANQGDTFATLQMQYQIDDQWSTSIEAAANYFNNSGKYEGHDLGDTKRQYAFRYASLGLAYQLLENVNLSGQYIVGGYDRFDIKQKDLGVIGVSYTF